MDPTDRNPTPCSIGSDDDDEGGQLHYRTVWISDIHLGTSGCQA